MPFVCGGFPLPGMTGQILSALERGGASIAEVGIPFSDPIADGPIIAAAMHTALGKGATPRSVFDEVRAFRDSTMSETDGIRDELAKQMLGAAGPGLGLVAMVSMSIVHRIAGGGGPRGFCEEARKAGFDGLIVPDAPLEESAALGGAARDAGLTLSLLVSPTTPPQRAERIVRACTGFVYLLARAGITGEQQSAPDIGPRVAALRKMTDLPIACGFGISTAEHVRAVAAHADAAIVGSALVRRMGEAHASGRSAVTEAETVTRDLCRGLPVVSA